MKPIQIWRHHVAIASLDLVMARNPAEPIEKTLRELRRLGFRTDASSVEIHDGVAAN